MSDNLTVKDSVGATQTISMTDVSGVKYPRPALAVATKGGASIYRNLDTQSTGVNVKNTAGQVYGWSIFNAAASTRYVKLYNKATAPTVGTDTPVMTIPVAAGTGVSLECAVGIAFSLGIGIGAVTGLADANTTAPTANDVITVLLYN